MEDFLDTKEEAQRIKLEMNASSTSRTATTDYLIMDKSADYVHEHHSFSEPEVTSSDCVLCPTNSQKPQWLIFFTITQRGAANPYIQ